MHTILPYSLATGGAVTDADMSATSDPEFTTRNSHFIFTEDYVLLAAAAFGATCTRQNMQVPHWNAIGRANIWPINTTSTTMKSPPQVSWFDRSPMDIPLMEEFQIKDTATGVAENDAAALVIAPANWNANLPQGLMTIDIRATLSSATLVSLAWVSAGVISLEQSLRGGVYSIISAECICTNGIFFRLIMPRQKMYKGRKLRPGWLCQNAAGDLEEARMQVNPFILGEWGRFHTFELPQVEIWAFTAGAQTAEVRLTLEYLGEAVSLLENWVGTGI